MRTVVRINFDASKIPGGARGILEAAQCGLDVATVEEVPEIGKIDVWVTLEKTDRRAPILLRLLKQHDRLWLERHEDRYTEEELDAARLLLMQPNRQCEIDGGVKWGMTYDLSTGCRVCGTGATQTSAVLVDGEELGELEGHRAGATYHWHLLVDDALAAELDRIGASGLSFRSVYAVMPGKRQVKLRWKQLYAARTLPPMSPRSSGFTRERACGACGRNGYFEMSKEPTRVVYRASDIHAADDVSFSWEHMGYAVLEPNLRDSLIAPPWMLVTPKVRRVFRDAGVTSFDWFPIRVDESDE